MTVELWDSGWWQNTDGRLALLCWQEIERGAEPGCVEERRLEKKGLSGRERTRCACGCPISATAQLQVCSSPVMSSRRG